MKKLSSDEQRFFDETVKPIIDSTQMKYTRKLIQHGNVSVFAHCMAVAAYSLRIADIFGIKCDKKSLVRGALLHDFFLYDWHKVNNIGDGLHGFAHPNTASKNAFKYFRLNKIELDIIRKHMWPLTLTKLPKYRESWIVCAADKYCSAVETLGLNSYGDFTFYPVGRPRRVQLKQPVQKH